MITVKEVVTKNDYKQFVEFPNQLYRNCNYYLPNYISEEYNLFNPSKNLAYDYSECNLFLCVDGDKVLGRVATVINHRYNEEHNVNELRFFKFDVVDNLDVSTALVNKMKNLAIENGLDSIVGTMGFNQFNHYGLLTNGFDNYSIYDAQYNHEYYINHLLKLNFVKDHEWNSYQITIPNTLDKRVDDITSFILKKYDLKLVSVVNVKKNEQLPDLMAKSIFLRMKNYDYLYSFNTISDKELNAYSNKFKTIIQLNSFEMAYYFVITDKNDDVVAFILGIPSIAKLLGKQRFKIMPSLSTVYKKATTKSDSVDLIGIIVKKEYQNIGLSLILQNELFKLCKKYDVKYINTDFDFDLSDVIKKDYQSYDMKLIKTFSSFRFDLIK